jgi:hypothetical protein
MTVGTPSGDTDGDLATQTAARVSTAREGVCSPEWFSGSRFWMLQPADDEDDGEDDGEGDGFSAVGDSARSVRYLCRTPSPVSDADLVEGSADLTRRHLKRIKRRDGQQMAARAAMLFSTMEGMISSPSMPLGKNPGSTVCKPMPVLEPSVFFDDNTEGWTVVRRRRWSPVSDVKVHDPRKKGGFKKVCCGPCQVAGLCQ